MKVTLLNKALNVEMGSIIRSFLLEGFPKPFLGEVAKHRLVSMSAESSRARPISKVMEQVSEDPYTSIWTKNQKGMSGSFFEYEDTRELNDIERKIRISVLDGVRDLNEKGVHKQDANRFLEPFMKCSVIITGTEFDNFYELRTAEGVQPALREFAKEMQRLDEMISPDILELGDWYSPYPGLSLHQNVAKCASISYANHNKYRSEEDAQRLLESLLTLKHFTPFEHCAVACKPGDVISMKEDMCQVFDVFYPEETLAVAPFKHKPMNTGNFAGFMSLRRLLAG